MLSAKPTLLSQKERYEKFGELKQELQNLGKAYLKNYPRGKFRLLPHNNQDIAEKLKNNTSKLNEAALLDFIYQIFNNTEKVGSLLLGIFNAVKQSGIYPQINATSDDIDRTKFQQLMRNPDDTDAITWRREDYLSVLRARLQSIELRVSTAPNSSLYPIKEQDSSSSRSTSSSSDNTFTHST